MGNATSRAAADVAGHEAEEAGGRAVEHSADSALEHRAEGSAGHRAESDAARSAESDAGRSAESDAARGAEGGAARAEEEGVAKRVFKGVAKLGTAAAAGVYALISLITALLGLGEGPAQVIAAILGLLATVLMVVGPIIMYLLKKTGDSSVSSSDSEIGSVSSSASEIGISEKVGIALEGRGFTGQRLKTEGFRFVDGITIAVLLSCLGATIYFFGDDIADIIPDIGGGSPCTGVLLRDKLACKVQNESLLISNYDGATAQECSESPLSDCDADKCATGVGTCTGTPTRGWSHSAAQATTCDNAAFTAHPLEANCPGGCTFSHQTCISCYELQVSLNADHEEESDPTDLDHLELYGLLAVGTYKILMPKFIKKRVARMAMAPLKKVGEILLEQIMKKAAEKAALMVAERLGARVTELVVADAVLGAAMLTPLAPFAAVGLAIVNYGMMESMAADILDVSGYRTYVSNNQQIDKRNAMDAPYIKHISPDSDEPVPPNQPPSIYQLDTLTYALKDSKIPEAKILYILAQAYIEAKVDWTIKVLDMSCDLISNKGMSEPYNHLIEIQLKGHAAGYSGVADGDLDLSMCNGTTEVYPDQYPGGYCTYELDLYSAFDSLINHLPQERDISIMDYITDHMKRHTPPASVSSFLRDPQSSITETNLWDDTSTAHLVGKSDEIIRPGFAATVPPRQYLGSDLIKNYGIGTEKLSGVSLTEAGCILLNQILDWESYIYPFTQTIEGIAPGIAPSVVASDLQGSLSYDIPKVAFSDYHRVITYVASDTAATGGENPTKLASVLNPGGISLPLYYPSHASTELSCKYGLQAVKLGGASDITLDTTAGDAAEQLVLIGAMEYMAHGDGTGQVGMDPWMPRLFGVSYDENLGVCKYDPAGGPAKGGEHYCIRMGRSAGTISPPLSENPLGHGSPGKTYNSCDETAVPIGWELTIGTEHYRDFVQWYDSW